MEFSETLSKLQGVICSLGRRGLLNEKGSLRIVIEELERITKGVTVDVKSEIAFFMVLNSNLSVCKQLEDDKFVGLFTNVFDFPIDKNYLVTYVYHLNLLKSLLKVVENCPGILGVELMDAIICKWKDPTFCSEFDIKQFYEVWKSAFVKIFKISIRKLNEDGTNFVSYFSFINNYIIEMIIKSMFIKDSENVVGCHLYEFFKSFNFFLELYETDNLPDDPLYELSVKLKDHKIYKNENLKDKCLNLIFEGLPKILEKITLQLWMTLHECYFDFDSKNSMQLLIGVEVASVVKKLKALNVSCNFLDCLSSFAIDKFAVAELDEIISNVKNGEIEWFSALIKHPSVTEEKSVECLLKMLNLASKDDLHEILNISYDYICNEENKSFEMMKTLFLTAMKKIDDSSKWIEKIFQKFKPGLLTTTHIQDDLVKTFNKISKEKNVPIEELIILCMQSPVETISKICSLAVYGSLPTEEVIKALKVLQIPCSALQCDGCTYLDHVILDCILPEDLTDRENLSLVNLVVQMGKENLLGTFFPKLLVNAVKSRLEKSHLEKAVLCLKIIEISIQSNVFAIDEIVLLVFLSQVLGHFAWDMESFSTIKADGRNLVISIVNEIINRMDKKENGITKHQWARMEILKSSEINRTCFCALWLREGQNWPNSRKVYSHVLTLAHCVHKTNDLEKFLVDFDQSLEKKASVVLSLTVLLPFLTFREWNSIFNGLTTVLESVCAAKDDFAVHHEVLDIFGSFLHLLTLGLKKKETYPCYEYCLRNFGKLIIRCCPKMSEKFYLRTLKKIVFVLGAIEDEHERKSCWMTITLVLVECLDYLKENNTIDDHRNEIEELLATSDVKDLAQTVAKRFT